MIVDMWIKRGYLFYVLRIHLSKVFIHSLFYIFNLILNEIVVFSTNFWKMGKVNVCIKMKQTAVWILKV